MPEEKDIKDFTTIDMRTRGDMIEYHVRHSGSSKTRSIQMALAAVSGLLHPGGRKDDGSLVAASNVVIHGDWRN